MAQSISCDCLDSDLCIDAGEGGCGIHAGEQPGRCDAGASTEFKKAATWLGSGEHLQQRTSTRLGGHVEVEFGSTGLNGCERGGRGNVLGVFHDFVTSALVPRYRTSPRSNLLLQVGDYLAKLMQPGLPIGGCALAEFAGGFCEGFGGEFLDEADTLRQDGFVGGFLFKFGACDL